MPYSSMSDVNPAIKGIKPPVSLGQANAIARMADAIEAKGGDVNGWAVAISNFKKNHTASDSKWVSTASSKEKSIACVELGEDLLYTLDEWKSYHLASEELGSIRVKELDNGLYSIESVSTAAVEDLEGETFRVEAIDYDIEQAKSTGQYPEFRVFHQKGLGIGRVNHMQRIGIFAVDRGVSYDDPFSLEICKHLLVNNDGTWRASRGFRLVEASGSCSYCGEKLLIREKHMLLGFRCPVCKTESRGRKVNLDGVGFTKARTFDVTITDNPAVLYTSVSANRIDKIGVSEMNLKELRSKLIKAGLSKDIVDAKLDGLDDDRLKEFDNLPDAEIFKSLGLSDEEGYDVVDLQDVMEVVERAVTKQLKDFTDGMQALIVKTMSSLEIEIPDVELDIPGIDEMSERLLNVEKSLSFLVTDEESRFK